MISVVSTEEKARLAERLGAHRAVVSSREDFVGATMEMTAGRGADVVYDAVGAQTFAASLAALAVRGRLVSFGQASGPIGERDIGGLASKSLTILRRNYGHFTDTPEKLAPHVGRFVGAMREGVGVRHVVVFD